MKKFSLKQRLMFLVFSLIIAEGLLIFVAISKSEKLLANLSNMSQKILPATRNLTLIDMHHDGLSARVYQALYYYEMKNTAKLAELQNETKVQSDEFINLLKEVNKITLDKSITDLIKESEPHIEKYSELAKSVVDYANEGNVEKLKQAQVDFFKEFKFLEDSLEVIGKKFEETSAVQNDEGKDIITSVILFSSVGLLLSLIISGFVLVHTQKVFSEVLDDSEEVSNTLTGLIDIVQEESNKVRDASMEQASAIQQSVSAMTEMRSMISQTSNNVKLSLETSQNAIQKTVEGKEIMSRMEQSMNSIQKSNSQLQDLSKVIEDISNKTTIINEIVFKTQLLSFNASIEAARAGQHGRGFSVVAEEVGNLAEMSGHAAKDIEALLEDSRRKVKDTLEVIQSRVNDSNRVSKMAYHAFQEVAVNIEEINKQVLSINEATQQQEIGIQQTNVAMRQVDTTSQGNSESSAMALKQANELKLKSELLKKANSKMSYLIRGKENPITASDIQKHELDFIHNSTSNIPNNSQEVSANDPDFKKFVA